MYCILFLFPLLLCSFVVLEPSEEYKPGTNFTYHREFSADGADALGDWITAIQSAINNLKSVEDRKETAGQKSDDSSSKAKLLGPDDIDINIFDMNLDGKKDGMSADSIMANASIGLGIGHSSVDKWLESLNLSKYAPNFRKHGYNDLQHINGFGLHTDDFNYLGITHPLHRRVLRVAAIAEYTTSLRAAVTDWQDIGSVVVYKVVSRWRFSRSCVFLKYSEFKKMHGIIVGLMKKPECSKLRANLPNLPDISEKVIQSRSAAFCNQRKEALENYLLALISLLLGTPIMKPLLETIGIIPKTLHQKMEATDKNGNLKRSDTVAFRL